MSRTENIVYDLAVPIVKSYNCDLVDVEFVKEGSNWYLRIFIDKDGGVTIEDCEKVSKNLSDVLDSVDPIKQSYYLEVSSPGIERPIKKEKDFIRFIGHKISVKLYTPIGGQKALIGILSSYKNDIVFLELDDGKIIEIPKDKIANSKLYFEF